MIVCVTGCALPAGDDQVRNDADPDVDNRMYYNETDSGRVPPCVPHTTFTDEAGVVHSVTFPCTSGGPISRGTSDPAGWGNDGYEPNPPPGTEVKLPTRLPPGDPQF